MCLGGLDQVRVLIEQRPVDAPLLERHSLVGHVRVSYSVFRIQKDVKVSGVLAGHVRVSWSVSRNQRGV